jgi:ubiquinone/menaquinone biosynthesis C-methylase UbiE
MRDYELFKGRDKILANLFITHIKPREKIIDIGPGNGAISRYLFNKRQIDTILVDVADKREEYAEDLKFLIYNGKKLPFKNDSFDTSLLVTVLHHIYNPEEVLKEAIRVTRNKVVIVEDVYNNLVEKYQTFIADSLANTEFFGHPHSNKSEKEWLKLFDKLNLELLNKKEIVAPYYFFHFRIASFVLKKS